MNNNENLSENINLNPEKMENEIIKNDSVCETKETKPKSQNLAIAISLAAFIIAVITVIVPFFRNNTPEEEPVETVIENNQQSPSIAFINTDSLLLNYEYSVKLNEDLLTEQSKSKASLTAMYRQFENKYNAFMEKAKLGSFLSQESMDRQQQDLVAEQQRIQTLEESMTQKLMEKQVAINAELLDTVVNFLKEFNKEQKYSMILNNAVVLYGQEGMDVTKEVTDALNNRYKSVKQ